MNWATVVSLRDLMPDCVLPEDECPVHKAPGDAHRLIQPFQQQIIDGSQTKYTYAQSGVGSGKTTIVAALVVKEMLEVPHNRGVVSRYNLDDLYDSAWRAVRECIERAVERKLIPQPKWSKSIQGEKTQVDFLHNGSALKAIHGKNWRRGLGADHGLFWVDDAYECEEEFFIGTGTSAGLISRLRLPPVRYDPATYHRLERPHGRLHGFVTSNPPPINSWIHKLFGNKPGVHRLGDDWVTWTQGETGDNIFTGENYAKGLMAVQRKMGHSDRIIQRVVFGKSIPDYGGVPVFPTQFDAAIHVTTLKFNPVFPLVRGVDFGFHHPACTFSMLYTCQYRINHYFTISEVADCYAATVYDFWDHFVQPHTDQFYKDAKLIVNGGDRAGYRASPSNRDRRGDMKILIEEYRVPFKWKNINLVPSLQYMRGLLKPREQCRCGLQLILIDKRCEVLIGALEGGYKFPKPKGGVVGDKPYEDRFFADVACAWRYGAENFQRYGVGWEDEKMLKRERLKLDHRRAVNEAMRSSYGWLDLPPASPELQELLLSG